MSNTFVVAWLICLLVKNIFNVYKIPRIQLGGRVLVSCVSGAGFNLPFKKKGGKEENVSALCANS